MPKQYQLILRADQPLGLPGNWTLVAQDRFQGSDIDGSRWFKAGSAEDGATTPPYNSFDYAEQDWSPANVTVSGGVLRCELHAGTPRVGGGICSRDRLNVGYGFVQFRARMSSTGWPACWNNAPVIVNGTDQASELDDAERAAWNGANTDIIHATHIQYVPTPINASGSSNNTGDQWHTYGRYWYPGGAQFYTDGVLTWTNTTNVPIAQPTNFQIFCVASFIGAGASDSGWLEVSDFFYWTGAPT